MTSAPPKRRVLRFLVLLALLGSGIAGLRVSHLGPLITDPHRLHAVIRGQGARAPLYFLLFNAVRPLLFVPASVAAVTSGILFGTFYGTVYSVVGATLGGIVAFFVARLLGRDFVEAMVFSGRLQTFDRMIERQGFKVIFVLRLIPVMYFDAVSFAAGVTRVRFRDYVIGTLGGLIPATFVWVYAGAALSQGKRAVWIALPLLATLLLIPFWWRWRSRARRRAGARASDPAA